MNNEGPGAWAKGMAGMMKAEFGGRREQREQNESISSVPKAGDKILLTKLSLGEGQTSSISAGESFEKVLTSNLALGEKILWGGGNTSPVRSLRLEGDRVIAETQTSVYELKKV